MTQRNSLDPQPFVTLSMVKRMLVGGGIALAAILVFVLGTPHPNPEWGKYWMIKPLIITPSAGAAGGVLFYFINNVVGYPDRWVKFLGLVLSCIFFIIALWMGLVLGLNGTMWN